MARDGSRKKPEARRRRPAAEEPAADPVGRLDEVLATLEQMLDGRGVPPAPSPPEAAGTQSPVENAADQEPLPLLQDMVAPAANGHPEGRGGEVAAVGAKADKPAASPEREPLSLGFEIVADEPLPRIGDLGLESPRADPVAGPGGERYGDAPSPSLAPEVYRHLIDRLANEIDVIVQTGIDEAMHRAAADIAAKARGHVAIILPEIIEELVRMSSRPSD